MMTALQQRGVFLKDSANELGAHPRTVRRALDRNGAPVRDRQSGVSKLDGHQEPAFCPWCPLFCPHFHCEKVDISNRFVDILFRP